MESEQQGNNKAAYVVKGSGTGYGHRWWDVELDRWPSSGEAARIARELDGGNLFGSRVESSDKPGCYRIVGYTD